MKIIFLDIDGVMNSDQYHKTVNTKQKNWRRFDPNAVKIITRLVEEFEAKIVISSLWRFAVKKELATELKESKLIKYLHRDWSTPILQPSHRGKEIQAWLEQHTNVKDYIIIDDDTDVNEIFNSRVVLTEMYKGMQEEHYYKARDIFEGEIKG